MISIRIQILWENRDNTDSLWKIRLYALKVNPCNITNKMNESPIQKNDFWEYRKRHTWTQIPSKKGFIFIAK